MSDQPQVIKPDFQIIIFPHNLERDWNIPEYIKYIERIESVFLFDKNLHVNCCELTSSYELWPITTRPIMKDYSDEMDTIRDYIEEIVRYASLEQGIEYHHVSDIDRLMSENADRWTKVTNKWNEIEEDETYEENMEALIEYCQCNETI